jgi:hypothetical protein
VRGGVGQVTFFHLHRLQRRGRHPAQGQPQHRLLLVEAAQQPQHRAAAALGARVGGAGHHLDQRRHAARQVGLEARRDHHHRVAQLAVHQLLLVVRRREPDRVGLPLQEVAQRRCMLDAVHHQLARLGALFDVGHQRAQQHQNRRAHGHRAEQHHQQRAAVAQRVQQLLAVDDPGGAHHVRAPVAGAAVALSATACAA